MSIYYCLLSLFIVRNERKVHSTISFKAKGNRSYELKKVLMGYGLFM